MGDPDVPIELVRRPTLRYIGASVGRQRDSAIFAAFHGCFRRDARSATTYVIGGAGSSRTLPGPLGTLRHQSTFRASSQQYRAPLKLRAGARLDENRIG